MEVHKKTSQALGLSAGLKSGHKIILTFSEGNLHISSYNKDNKPAGKSTMPASDVIGIADKVMGQYISIEKLQQGYRYVFVPANMIYCKLLCQLHGETMSTEKILLALIKKYENMKKNG